MFVKKIGFIIILLLLSKISFSKTYAIHSAEEYENISFLLQPGDDVSIANGTYSPWSLIINCNGTADKPITIHPEEKGKVIFSGEVLQAIFILNGSYTVLSGIQFTGCNLIKGKGASGILVELNNSKYCRLTQCTFTNNEANGQYMPLVTVSGKGFYNQVDHCMFSSNLNNQELQVRIEKENYPQFTLIEKNIFQDKKNVTWKNFNGGECVQVGQDPVLLGGIQSNTTVRENNFIRCKGEPEVISNKCSNNKYIKNIFKDCDGELVMRGGHDCIIDSNIINGGNCGIRVNGTGHQITHNKISNVKTAIRLMYGMASGKKDIGFYIAASDCTLQFNKIKNVQTGILIGDSKNADWTGKFDTKRYPSPVMQNVAPFNNIYSENSFKKTRVNILVQ